MYDVFIVGGGINGCGIARDAAGRGYSVYLAEMNDLASGTSSWSTKLVHGGLRYLEHYEFRLVREALMEREVLWRNAPHIIWPLRFVLPHQKDLRPAWFLRLGLFLYDHIGGRNLLPPTRTLDLKTDPAGAPLKQGFGKAFEYSDCWVDDARLVVMNARDAADRGAMIKTRTKVTRIKRTGGHWQIIVEDQKSGDSELIEAKLLVNAGGPWVDQILRGPGGQNDAHNVRLVQGSHIVVPRLFEHDRCYIFQNGDGRIVFAIPYENDFTLIGTTDRDYDGDPGSVAITDEEIDYLCAAASEYFANPIHRDMIVWTYSGVRPLYDDGASLAQEATRDYVLKIDDPDDGPAMINVFGGKITTFRRLAESALEMIGNAIGEKGEEWTRAAALPGGDFPANQADQLLDEILADHPFLNYSQARHLVRHYGTMARSILGNAQSESDLGQSFGAGLSEAEIRHLIDNEWAETVDDILWRRTKIGLRMTDQEKTSLSDWLVCQARNAA